MRKNGIRHYQKKRSKLVPVLLTALIVVILAAVVFVLVTKQTKGSKKTETTTSLSAKDPTKTTSSNGYEPSSSIPVASGTAELTEDTGGAQWVQVKSATQTTKFTDLSNGSIKIIKANNPQVLKTAVSTTTPAVLMADVVARFPNTAIMNASGFDMNTGFVASFQINNGQLFRDWSSSTETTFVINKDGTCAAYDSSTPASEILQKGAAMSFSFGGIIMKDGAIVPSDGSFDWKKHSLIGNDKDNNIYLIVTDTNYGYDGLLQAISGFNMQNLVLMDGGGSSQLTLNGETLFPSEDNRAVPDYIVLK
ncbi:phosphodiester glycosidase family protein [Lactovum odontotermitis]